MKPTVAIVGVGLIGGSLGMALRRTKKYRVIGVGRNAESLKRALRLGAVDEWSTEFSKINKADIVVLAMPVAFIVPVYKQIFHYLKGGAIVTDVGSVKGEILKHLPASASFVGAHPIAGSHKTGVAFSRADLFKKAVCVIVPGSPMNSQIIARMWKAAGATPVYMSATSHDRAVAFISHLPHVLAHAMVQAVMRDKDQKSMKRLLAGSFRDVTRVASSDADQWAQILNANKSFVKKAIRGYISELNSIDKKIGTSKLTAHLKRSQHYREPLFQ